MSDRNSQSARVPTFGRPLMKTDSVVGTKAGHDWVGHNNVVNEHKPPPPFRGARPPLLTGTAQYGPLRQSLSSADWGLLITKPGYEARVRDTVNSANDYLVTSPILLELNRTYFSAMDVYMPQRPNEWAASLPHPEWLGRIDSNLSRATQHHFRGSSYIYSQRRLHAALMARLI